MNKKPNLTLKLDSEQLKLVPQVPGIYLFRNREGKVLYVGKAVNLQSRLRSYLRPESHSPRIDRMKKHIEVVDLFVTETEKEAFLLEDIMIKQHRPPLNVRFRDDKTYPYIRISVQETYPKLSVVRRRQNDGARYFGPHTSSFRMKETISLIQDIFQIATCNIEITGKEPRACLEYQIHRCSAPCTGAISKEEYRESVHKAILFLEGKQKGLIQTLRQEMEEAAEALQFERAAKLRDRLFAVQSVQEKQKIVLDASIDCDAIGWAQENSQASLCVVRVREGKLKDRENVLFATPQDAQQTLGEALKRFYWRQETMPELLLLPYPVENQKELYELAEAKGQRIRIGVPRRGQRRAAVQVAQENAEVYLQIQLQQEKIQEKKAAESLSSLQQLLGLDARPARIECVDISHFQGFQVVGSLVCFVNGRPFKDGYRRYRVRHAQIDDPAAIKEVVSRRLERGKREGNLPDLLVVDGGLGQLHSAQQAVQEKGVRLPVIALAKREETIYDQQGKAIQLPLHWGALQLLQQIRDEAHRFALSFHRESFQKQLLNSPVCAIKGVGEKTRKKILKSLMEAHSFWEIDKEKLFKDVRLSQTAKQKVLEALQVEAGG